MNEDILINLKLKADEAAIKAATEALKQMEVEISKLEKSAPLFAQKLKQIAAIQKELAKHTQVSIAEMKKQEAAFDSLANKIINYNNATSRTNTGIKGMAGLFALMGATSEAAGEAVRMGLDLAQQAIDATIEKAEKVNENLKLVQRTMGLTGEAAERMASQITTNEEKLNLSAESQVKAQKAIQGAYGVSAEEASRYIRTLGLTATNGEEQLDYLTEYGSQLAEMGYTLEESTALLINFEKAGAFSDKGPDTIKELNNSFSALNATQIKTLKSLGPIGDEIKNTFESGDRSKAVAMLTKELDTLAKSGVNVRGIFAEFAAGPGEDLTAKFLNIIGSSKGARIELTAYQQSVLDLVSSQDAVNIQLAELINKFSSLGHGAETLWNTIQANLLSVLNDLVDWFIKTKAEATAVGNELMLLLDPIFELGGGVEKVTAFLGRMFTEANQFALMGKAVTYIIDGMKELVTVTSGVIAMIKEFSNQVDNLENAAYLFLTGRAQQAKEILDASTLQIQRAGIKAYSDSKNRLAQSLEDEKKMREDAAKAEANKAAQDEKKKVEAENKERAKANTEAAKKRAEEAKKRQEEAKKQAQDSFNETLKVYQAGFERERLLLEEARAGNLVTESEYQNKLSEIKTRELGVEATLLENKDKLIRTDEDLTEAAKKRLEANIEVLNTIKRELQEKQKIADIDRDIREAGQQDAQTEIETEFLNKRNELLKQSTIKNKEDIDTEILRLEAEKEQKILEIQRRGLEQQRQIAEEKQRLLLNQLNQLEEAGKGESLQAAEVRAQVAETNSTIVDLNNRIAQNANANTESINKVNQATQQAAAEQVQQTANDISSITDTVVGTLNDVLSNISQINQARLAVIDAQMQASEDRMDLALRLAEQGNDQLLNKEIQNQEKLQEEKEKIADREVAIAKIMAIANIVAAVAKVAAQSGIGAPIAIPVVIGAIAGLIPVAKGLFQGAFADGVVDFKGKGGPKDDLNPVLISSGESVITAKGTNNAKKALEMINEGKLSDKDIFSTKYKVLPNMGESENFSALAQEFAEMKQTMNGVLNEVKNFESKVSFRPDGMVQYVKTSTKRITKIDKRR